MDGLRQTAKRAVESLLARGGMARWWGPGRGAVLILAYHNIRPDGAAPAGDRPLHLPLARFREQLDLLHDRLDVVPLEEALLAPRGDRPRVAITFDDAYRGAVTVGIPELVARGLPATVFVAPAFLGGRSFWWDALAGEGGLAPEHRSRALGQLRGEDAKVREWAVAAGLPVAEPPEDCRAAAEAELSAAAANPGITVGSHTWSHPNLARLGAAELAEELSRPLAWLRERFGRVTTWLSYPYGSWTPDVAAAAAAAGHEAALRVEGGWLDRDPADRYAIPRLNVPAGISADGFALRLTGLFCR